MRIDVTESHIERGKRGSSSCCPIAIAVREAFSMEEHEVEVYEADDVVRISLLRINEGGGTYWEDHDLISNDAAQWIRDFDNGKPVYPCFVDTESWAW